MCNTTPELKVPAHVLFALAFVMLVFVSCSGKSSKSSKKKDSSKSSSIVKPTSSWSSEAEKAFKAAKIVPPSDLRYELTDDGEGVRINKYVGSETEISIPSEIEGMPVRELKWNMFFVNGQLRQKTVVLPDSVETIIPPSRNEGKGMFSYGLHLRYVRLPKSLHEIHYCFFRGSENIEEFVIPDGVKSIGKLAFNGTGIKSVFIPDSVTEVGEKAFEGCKKLESARLSEKMTYIGERMFYQCHALKEITIPSSVTKICREAFRGCVSLVRFDIPASVRILEGGAIDTWYLEVVPELYEGPTSGLSELVIPETVTQIEGISYLSCLKLTLPNYITELYGGNVAWRSINFPASLTKWGGEFPPYLEEIRIPDSLTHVEFQEDAFCLCVNIPLATQKRLRELGYKGKFAQK